MVNKNGLIVVTAMIWGKGKSPPQRMEDEGKFIAYDALIEFDLWL